MWFSIDVFSSDMDIIYLPEPAARRMDKKVKIAFGRRVVSAEIYPSYDFSVGETNSFELPETIRMSAALRDKLLLPANLKYRMKIYRNYIIIGPVIGLLIGNHNHEYSPEHMEKYSDRFGIYSSIGGLIYAFSSRSVDWNSNQVYGLYFNYEKQSWEFGKFPLPDVIYRRDFHTHPDMLKRLIQVSKGRLFNSWRFSKFFLYQYLQKDNELKKYLPATELMTGYGQVKKFIGKHGKVILKPVNLSRGRGICIIEKDAENYKVHDYRGDGNAISTICNEQRFDGFLRKNSFFFNRYIIQQHLSLAKVDDSVFDIRVVMQKDSELKWGCTGIECRVAGKDSMLTNISRGGYALPIEEAFEKAFPGNQDNEKMIKELHLLCFKMCTSLDKMGHHFAEFGIDIAVDKDRKFWIIEANVFPSFKGFKKMNYETYLSIRYAPMIYAASLIKFQ